MLTVVGKNPEKFGNPASPEKRRDREEKRRGEERRGEKRIYIVR
jgi:hypothetical protein